MKEEKDNIADFFKNKLSQEAFEYDPAQWDRMEAQLDAEMPVGSTGWGGEYFGVITGVTVAILALIASFFMGWFSHANQEDHLITESNSPQTELTIADQAIHEKTENNGHQRMNDAYEKANQIHSITSKNNSAAITPTSNETLPTTVITSQIANESTDEVDLNENMANILSKQHSATSESGTRSDKTKKKDIATADNVTHREINQEPLVPVQQPFNKEQSTVFIPSGKQTNMALLDMNHNGFPFVMAHDNPTTGLVLNKTVATENAEEKTSPKYRKQWTLNAFVAPDFNSTTFSSIIEGKGIAGGITVNFHPTARLKVGLGAVLNNKIYTAQKGDYTPEKGFWTNKIAPESTEATCLALDIPINIGYQIIQGNRSLWVNAGVSSYWLLNEQYQYIYENPDPGLVQSWQGKRENFNAFGSLNFSISYIQQFNDRMALLIEPYFKTPLKGIGEGSVELLNGGVNIGITYWMVKANTLKKK